MLLALVPVTTICSLSARVISSAARRPIRGASLTKRLPSRSLFVYR
ncbi:hypothetical protein RCH22_004274 [Cryobacterium psychrotolerans]|nr:hypothetical protein [Cryobacterium psychrotolerans]